MVAGFTRYGWETWSLRKEVGTRRPGWVSVYNVLSRGVDFCTRWLLSYAYHTNCYDDVNNGSSCDDAPWLMSAHRHWLEAGVRAVACSGLVLFGGIGGTYPGAGSFQNIWPPVPHVEMCPRLG